MSLDEYASLHLDRILTAQVPKLTPRQRQVAVAWHQGLCWEVIATDLGITIRTVRAHLRAVYGAVGVCQRFEFIKRVDEALWDDREERRG